MRRSIKLVKYPLLVLLAFFVVSILCFYVYAAVEQDGNVIHSVSIEGKPFAGGDGTAEHPYLITTPAHLNNVRDFLYQRNADGTFDTTRPNYYEQTNDITLIADDFTNGAGNFAPIGTLEEPFPGTYEGHHYTIYSANISSNERYVGLFGVLAPSATINSISIQNSTISHTYTGSDGACGSLVGLNNGILEWSFSTADVVGSGSNYAGGLVGVNTGDIIDSYNAGTVSAPYAGGIVGHLNSTAGHGIYGCYSSGSVTGTNSAPIGSRYTSGDNTGVIWLDSSSPITTAYRTNSPASTSGSTTPALRSVTSSQLSCQTQVDGTASMGDNNAIALLTHTRAYMQLSQYFYSPTAYYTYPMIWSNPQDKNYQFRGSGTDVDPFIITNPQHISIIGRTVSTIIGTEDFTMPINAHYVIYRSLYFYGVDLNSTLPGNLIPIGTTYNTETGVYTTETFTGHITGALSTWETEGHESVDVCIYGVRIAAPQQYLGFVPIVGEGASIQGLSFYDMNIALPSGIGQIDIGFVSGNNNGLIKYCSNFSTFNLTSVINDHFGTTPGSEYVSRFGGIAGDNNGRIISCKNVGDLTVNSANPGDLNAALGGITGLNLGTITNSFNEGTITGSTPGGITYNNAITGTITTCFNSGDIIQPSGSVSNIQAGISVYNQSGAILRNCFNTGKTLNGITFSNLDSTITNCFYLQYTDYSIAGNGTALSASQMAGHAPVSGTTYILDILNSNPNQQRFIFNRVFLGLDNMPYQFPHFSNNFVLYTNLHAMQVDILGNFIVDTPQKFLGIGSTHNSVFYSNNGHFIQYASLNFSGITFTPIYEFYGRYNGDDKVISNISCSLEDEVGLFRQILGEAVVTRLGVYNSTFTSTSTSGPRAAGGFAAFINGSVTINGCSVSGSTISAYQACGGFVGYVNGTSSSTTGITNCFVANSSIFSTNTSNNDVRAIGGFVGFLYGSCKIEECYYSTSNRASGTSAAVRGNRGVGGFVGSIQNTATINNCYSYGSLYTYNDQYYVSDTDLRNTIGGFVGQFIGGTITNSYANVITSGANLGSGTGITNFKTAAYSFGCAVGGTATGCYSLSGQTRAKSPRTNAATEVSEAQLHSQGTFAGWDFSSVWIMDTLNSFPSYNCPRLRDTNFNEVAHPRIIVITDNNCLVQLWRNGTLIASQNSTIYGGVMFYDLLIGEYDILVHRYGIMTTTPQNYSTAASRHVEIIHLNAPTETSYIVNTDDWFVGGQGIETDPYRIKDAFNLERLHNYDNNPNNAYFLQLYDIDYQGATLSPIEAFTSHYDGGGHQITNFVMEISSSHSGFIRVATGGSISNLGVSFLTINSTSTDSSVWTGGLVGVATGTTISRCYIKDSNINVVLNGGGLVGKADNATIEYSFAKTSLSSTNTNSLSSSVLGGLVAQADNGTTINQCYSMGTINGVSKVGGLVGIANDVDVTDSHTRCNIITSYSGTSSADVGGAFGIISASSSANRVFQYATVSASGAGRNFGAFAGTSATTDFTDCYYYAVNQFADIYSGTAGLISPLTALEFLNMDSFNNYDFAIVWGMPESVAPDAGAPVLRMTLSSSPIVETMLGSGTIDDPYLIANFEMFDNIRNIKTDINGIAFPYFKLVADITLNNTFLPIGHLDNLNDDNSDYFVGSLDGNNKMIRASDLVESEPYTMGEFGLIGAARNSIIKNIRSDGFSIEISNQPSGDNGNMLGLLLGYSFNNTIDNIQLTNGSITADNLDSVAGIAGYSLADTITNCVVSNLNIYPVIEGTKIATYIGGVTGVTNGSTISNCSVNNSMIDDIFATYAGGIAAVVWDNSSDMTTISYCNVTSTNIRAVHTAGGILGHAKGNTKIFGCKTLSSAIIGGVTIGISTDVTTHADGFYDNAGGIVGTQSSDYSHHVISCYTDSNIYGGAWVGGIVGTSNIGAIMNCTVKNTLFSTHETTYNYGGVVCLSIASNISGCSVNQNSNLSATNFIGGLVAVAYGGSVINSSFGTPYSTNVTISATMAAALCAVVNVTNPVIQYNKIANVTITATANNGKIYAYDFATNGTETNVNNNYVLNVTSSGGTTHSETETTITNAESEILNHSDYFNWIKCD